MVIGFTGSRNGMSTRQKEQLKTALKECDIEFHHGDCIGADEEAHQIVLELHKEYGWNSYYITLHPPIRKIARAFCESEDCELDIESPKPYLQRNRDIVNACQILIAAPEGEEHLRSGTWSTVRYARSQNKPVLILKR